MDGGDSSRSSTVTDSCPRQNPLSMSPLLHKQAWTTVILALIKTELKCYCTEWVSGVVIGPLNRLYYLLTVYFYSVNVN